MKIISVVTKRGEVFQATYIADGVLVEIERGELKGFGTTKFLYTIGTPPTELENTDYGINIITTTCNPSDFKDTREYKPFSTRFIPIDCIEQIVYDGAPNE